jgi:hypothetical protein
VQERIIYNKQQAFLAREEEKGDVKKPMVLKVLETGRTVPAPEIKENDISQLPLAINMRREHEWIHVYDEPYTMDARYQSKYNRLERVCRYCKIHHRDHRQDCILREVVKPKHRLPETFPADWDIVNEWKRTHKGETGVPMYIWKRAGFDTSRWTAAQSEPTPGYKSKIFGTGAKEVPKEEQREHVETQPEDPKSNYKIRNKRRTKDQFRPDQKPNDGPSEDLFDFECDTSGCQISDDQIDWDDNYELVEKFGQLMREREEYLKALIQFCRTFNLVDNFQVLPSSPSIESTQATITDIPIIPPGRPSEIYALVALKPNLEVSTILFSDARLWAAQVTTWERWSPFIPIRVKAQCTCAIGVTPHCRHCPTSRKAIADRASGICAATIMTTRPPVNPLLINYIFEYMSTKGDPRHGDHTKGDGPTIRQVVEDFGFTSDTEFGHLDREQLCEHEELAWTQYDKFLTATIKLGRQLSDRENFRVDPEHNINQLTSEEEMCFKFVFDVTYDGSFSGEQLDVRINARNVIIWILESMASVWTGWFERYNDRLVELMQDSFEIIECGHQQISSQHCHVITTRRNWHYASKMLPDECYINLTISRDWHHFSIKLSEQHCFVVVVDFWHCNTFNPIPIEELPQIKIFEKCEHKPLPRRIVQERNFPTLTDVIEDVTDILNIKKEFHAINAVVPCLVNYAVDVCRSAKQIYHFDYNLYPTKVVDSAYSNWLYRIIPWKWRETGRINSRMGKIYHYKSLRDHFGNPVTTTPATPFGATHVHKEYVVGMHQAKSTRDKHVRFIPEYTEADLCCSPAVFELVQRVRTHAQCNIELLNKRNEVVAFMNYGQAQTYRINWDTLQVYRYDRKQRKWIKFTALCDHPGYTTIIEAEEVERQRISEEATNQISSLCQQLLKIRGEVFTTPFQTILSRENECRQVMMSDSQFHLNKLLMDFADGVRFINQQQASIDTMMTLQPCFERGFISLDNIRAQSTLKQESIARRAVCLIEEQTFKELQRRAAADRIHFQYEFSSLYRCYSAPTQCYMPVIENNGKPGFTVESENGFMNLESFLTAIDFTQVGLIITDENSSTFYHNDQADFIHVDLRHQGHVELFASQPPRAYFPKNTSNFDLHNLREKGVGRVKHTRFHWPVETGPHLLEEHYDFCSFVFANQPKLWRSKKQYQDSMINRVLNMCSDNSINWPCTCGMARLDGGLRDKALLYTMQLPHRYGVFEINTPILCPAFFTHDFMLQTIGPAILAKDSATVDSFVVNCANRYNNAHLDRKVKGTTELKIKDELIGEVDMGRAKALKWYAEFLSREYHQVDYTKWRIDTSLFRLRKTPFVESPITHKVIIKPNVRPHNVLNSLYHWKVGAITDCGHTMHGNHRWCHACWNMTMCKYGHFLLRHQSDHSTSCGLCDEPLKLVLIWKRWINSTHSQLFLDPIPYPMKRFVQIAVRGLKGGEFASDVKLEIHKYVTTTVQSGCTATGIVFGSLYSIVPHADTQTAIATLSSRCVRKFNDFDPDERTRAMSMVKTFCDEMLHGIGEIIPWKEPRWIKRFPRARQNQLYKAIMYNRHGGKLRKKRKMFLKRELLVKKQDTLQIEQEFASRAIMSRAELDACPDVGPWMCAASEALKEHWSRKRRSELVYACGMNAEQVGLLFQELHGGVDPFHADARKYDCTLDLWWLDVESRIFTYLGLQKHPRAWEAYRASRQTVAEVWIKGQKSITLEFEGRRLSGDEWTSLGNSLLNGFLHWYGMRVNNIAISPGFIAVGGDDSMGATSISSTMYRDIIVETHARLGIETDMVAAPMRWDLKFLGSMGYPIKVKPPSTQCIMAGPLMNRYLAKAGWSLDAQIQPEAWLHGVCIGWQKLVNYIPPLKAMNNAMLRNVKHVRPIKVDFVHGSFREEHLQPTEWWDADEIRFGIMLQVINMTTPSLYGSLSMESCRDFCRLMARVNTLPCITDHQFVRGCVDLE